MCERHSFILTRSGQVHDGFGITDSHTTILDWAGLGANYDKANAYEWQQPKGWPEAAWEYGLTKDNEVFVPKSSHLAAIGAHIKKIYPDAQTWEAGDKPRGTLPQSVGGSLDVSGCDLSGVTLPQSIGGWLDVSGCDLSGVTLPQSVGGSLDVSGCDLSGVTLPQSIGGSLYVSGCDLSGVTLPQNVRIIR